MFAEGLGIVPKALVKTSLSCQLPLEDGEGMEGRFVLKPHSLGGDEPTPA